MVSLEEDDGKAPGTKREPSGQSSPRCIVTRLGPRVRSQWRVLGLGDEQCDVAVLSCARVVWFILWYGAISGVRCWWWWLVCREFIFWCLVFGGWWVVGEGATRKLNQLEHQQQRLVRDTARSRTARQLHADPCSTSAHSSHSHVQCQPPSLCDPIVPPNPAITIIILPLSH